ERHEEARPERSTTGDLGRLRASSRRSKFAFQARPTSGALRIACATWEDALARYVKPEILNTDQGSQFTGAAFTGVLIENEIAISMDGKGAWRDNVFVERLWRSVKYEEV